MTKNKLDLPPDALETLKGYLREDIRTGDITTRLIGPLESEGVGTVFAKSKSILAGVKEALAIGNIVGLVSEDLMQEGTWIEPGQAALRLIGTVETILKVERVILNIIMRMSGIATLTHEMMSLLQRHNPAARIAATRKTTPGFRFFEKRAVEIGGGDTHRYALDDMVLIKNNHVTAIGGVSQAVLSAREKASFSKKISCEVRSLQDAISAAESGSDIILLDNFSSDEVAHIVRVLTERNLRDRVILEVSGGINLSNIEEYAKTGVDVISSGALTHSYESADFNLLISLK